MLRNLFRQFWQYPLDFASCCPDLRSTWLWKIFKSFYQRKRSCLCLEFHWTQLLVWARSGLFVWIRFPCYYGKKLIRRNQSQASWLCLAYGPISQVWALLAGLFGNPDPAWGKVPPSMLLSLLTGITTPKGQSGLTQTHLVKYLGKFLVKQTSAIHCSSPETKNVKKRRKNSPEETLKDKILTTGTERLRLRTSVPKPVRSISKSSQSWEVLALRNV